MVENQIGATAEARGISREAVIRDVLLAAQPTRRFAEVDEIGALAVFLSRPRREVDHRHRAAGRRRLDGALSMLQPSPPPPRAGLGLPLRRSEARRQRSSARGDRMPGVLAELASGRGLQ